MRYVVLSGGLGNQMFQYAYMVYLKQFFPDVTMFIPSTKWEHVGQYELYRAFGINRTQSRWEKIYKWGRPFTTLFHLLHPSHNGRNFKLQPSDLSPNHRCRYFIGTWQSDIYNTPPHCSYENSIIDVFKFRTSNISENTQAIAHSIRRITAVSLHVRRGDYLSDAFKDGFGGCCTIDYYKRAVEYMVSKISDCTFVVFSDDQEWVRQNLKIDNAIYVDHNKGVDAWQDMYLMTLCKHNIIANSSFSWWAARLNQNPDKIVIAPKTWWNGITDDDVVPDSWIRM